MIADKRKAVAVFGIGGHAREIAWLLEAHPSFATACFVVDGDDPPDVVNDIPVLCWQDYAVKLPYTSIVVAIGDLHDRRDLVGRCEKLKLSFPRLVDHGIRQSKFVTVGEGAIICSGTTLTVNITIGRHVHINRSCSISHDVEIGDFTTLSPGVNVSGHVKIGADVFIGSGATIVNGSSTRPLMIADGAVIGASACVTKSIGAAGVYKGVPARRLV